MNIRALIQYLLHSLLYKSLEPVKLDYKFISCVELGGINTGDYPDFVDAYIDYAEYKGVPLTDAQLDLLNTDYDYIHECVFSYLY